MSDFFDQDIGNEDDGMDDVPMTNTPEGASVLVNGSYQPLEVGAPFLQSMKNVALQAGFGKFKVWLNGTEIRPSAIKEGRVPSEVTPDMRAEIRPFDEAGIGEFFSS
jgi:hypothetical protein